MNLIMCVGYDAMQIGDLTLLLLCLLLYPYFKVNHNLKS
jgi:hypothetical protein